jgi:hypothetical protein
MNPPFGLIRLRVRIDRAGARPGAFDRNGGVRDKRRAFASGNLEG